MSAIRLCYWFWYKVWVHPNTGRPSSLHCSCKWGLYEVGHTRNGCRSYDHFSTHKSLYSCFRWGHLIKKILLIDKILSGSTLTSWAFHICTFSWSQLAHNHKCKCSQFHHLYSLKNIFLFLKWWFYWVRKALLNHMLLSLFSLWWHEHNPRGVVWCGVRIQLVLIFTSILMRVWGKPFWPTVFFQRHTDDTTGLLTKVEIYMQHRIKKNFTNAKGLDFLKC